MQHATLTLTLWIVYVAGAVCGGFATDRWELRGMFVPLAVLATITAYGVFRPLLEELNEEW